MKWIATLLIPLLLAMGCEMLSGKGGVETTNGISGIIQDPSGNPVAHAQVALVPDAYDGADPGKAGEPERTETDAKGRYRFADVVAGTYNLESSLTSKNLRAWLPGLDIRRNRSGERLADMALKQPGVLVIPFADRHLPENAILSIPGTTIAMSIVGKIGASGDLTVPGLPEGGFPSLMAHFPDTNDGGALAVCHAFEIRSGDTTRLSALSSWSGRKTIPLDFTGRGGPAQPMDGHPILIRFDASTFDFRLARTDGRDIRLTDAGGAHLPFQIERWDAVSKEAALWFRLASLPRERDTVVLHWGRPDALDLSDCAAVFDTSRGFAAVWHLGESGSAALGGYKDATLGGHHATGLALGEGSFKAIAGMGQRFPVSAGRLTASMPSDLEGGKSFSVTFWMNYQANPLRQTILSLGEEAPNLGFHFLIRPDSTAQFGPFDSAGSGNPSPRQNSFSLAPYRERWIFIATVYDAPHGTLTTYVDGALAATSVLPPIDMRASAGLRIGSAIFDARDPQSDFTGGLDEIRLYDEVLGAESIRLEHAIQGAGID